MNAGIDIKENYEYSLKKSQFWIIWPLDAWLCTCNMLKWCFQGRFPPCHYGTVHTDGCFWCKSRQPSAAWVPWAGTTTRRTLGRGVCLPGTDWSLHIPHWHYEHTWHQSATQAILVNPIPYANPREYITTVTFFLSSLAKATGFPVISNCLLLLAAISQDNYSIKTKAVLKY